MAFLVTVIERNPRKVLFNAFRLSVIGTCIISSSRCIRAGVFLFVFLFLKPIFRLFPSLFGSFYIVGEIICRLNVIS